MIKSISYSQIEILSWIKQLYNNNEQFECDCCYSKGNFYKNDTVKPKYCFDIIPQLDYVKQCDCRNLPLHNHSITSIVYDPPFLSASGKSLTENNNNNKINKRFGVFPTEKELFQFYEDSIKEFSRVLQVGGLLVIKCQDKVSSGKQIISHKIILDYCEKYHFICEDIFILLAKNRLVAQWQLKNQKHARKFHSYFLVLKRGNYNERIWC